MYAPFPYYDDLLTEKRGIGDVPADLLIATIFKNADSKIEFRNWLAGLTDNKQLEYLPDAYSNIALINKSNQLPVWANTRLMQTGSTFFIRHSQTIMTLLGLLSLPYCYTAANGAMVLYMSERMRNDTTQRLYETAAFVWEVMAPDAFGRNGKGFASILKVRLLHAAIRSYTSNSDQWDPLWGVPVNQEDMAGTNLSFSFIVIRGLRKLGFSVSQSDQLGFMHLWNVIGYLSGLDEDLLPRDAKQAQLLDAAISARQFRVSAHGMELTKSLTDHITAINTSKASNNDILGLMRYLLGYNVADMLAITSPELPLYKLSLIKTMNLIKGLKPMGNVNDLYREAHAKFKQQRPAEKQADRQ